MNRELRQALEASAEGRAYLARQESAKRARARRVGAKPAVKDRKAAKAAREARLAAETARIRAAVDARDPACVICGEPAPEPWEMHHVDSGSGKTQRQSVRNCAKAHEGCHKRAHRGDVGALVRLFAWARLHEYAETARVVEHRLAKISEARGASRALEGRR